MRSTFLLLVVNLMPVACEATLRAGRQHARLEPDLALLSRYVAEDYLAGIGEPARERGDMKADRSFRLALFDLAEETQPARLTRIRRAALANFRLPPIGFIQAAIIFIAVDLSPVPPIFRLRRAAGSSRN